MGHGEETKYMIPTIKVPRRRLRRIRMGKYINLNIIGLMIIYIFITIWMFKILEFKDAMPISILGIVLLPFAVYIGGNYTLNTEKLKEGEDGRNED